VAKPPIKTGRKRTLENRSSEGSERIIQHGKITIFLEGEGQSVRFEKVVPNTSFPLLLLKKRQNNILMEKEGI